MQFLFFLISFGASIIGAICGIGGGVIIKPALDAFQLLDVAAISFLSGCTVLSMSAISVFRSKHGGQKSLIDLRTGTPLAIGAAIGGILGKELFQQVAGLFPDPNKVGAVQSICLLVITVGTLIYTLYKNNISTHQMDGTIICTAIGLVLGVMSSFLGIGGGPINLVVLSYFFSMDTKTAAQNSLYVILFSQLTSLASTLLTGQLPQFSLFLLLLMVAGGFAGGICGGRINRMIDAKAVDRLFIGLMVVIIGICIYNTICYLG